MFTKILPLLRTNFIMLTRQRGLIISSLGLAVISMLVFGFLFGSNSASKTRLGVVDQDHTPVSAQIASQLQKSDALQVFTGGSDEEQQALRDGQRDAVIILPAGFSQQLVQGGAAGAEPFSRRLLLVLGRDEPRIYAKAAALDGVVVEAAAEGDAGLHYVKSPIVGTFYESPSPGAPPFVKVGDAVTDGQVLCIIEAMKLMNEIESDAAGEVVKLMVSNGQPVEYGQPLFALRAK